jgi:hypothetical protein
LLANLKKINNKRRNFILQTNGNQNETILLTCFFTCFAVIHFSTAQDYVITNKGDTLQGEIKLLSFDLLDRVQVKIGKEKKVYTAKEAIICSIKGKLYRPVGFNNSIRFMKVIRYGYLSLYAFNYPNQQTYDNHLLVKLGGTSMEVPNLLFTKVMVNYLDDCPTIKEKFKIENYGQKDIEKIVDEYNVCLAEQTKLLSAAELTNQTLAGLNTLRAKVENLEDFPTKQDALDLIKDMTSKLKNKETIPNYLLEGLNRSLSEMTDVKVELDSVLSQLR